MVFTSISLSKNKIPKAEIGGKNVTCTLKLRCLAELFFNQVSEVYPAVKIFNYKKPPSEKIVKCIASYILINVLFF